MTTWQKIATWTVALIGAAVLGASVYVFYSIYLAAVFLIEIVSLGAFL